MPKILIATHNSWKEKLFASLLNGSGFETVLLKEIATPPIPPIENGTTVIENALIKARHYHSTAYPWVFSDDTGLEIDALNGEPGVQTRRWGGRLPDDISDQAWLEYLLLRMNNVPHNQRTASFVDGWALIDPQYNEYTHLTRSSFHIATHSVRPMLPGSPIMAVALGI
ncbi:MAG TPA: non-canonical purine NTP pyrophosphatase, partial [Bacillota bacterium]|nr:non-canonical purine NTP pyrophosphatase [Bacillota bacterium]